ncbi:MAG: hypothetical protein V1921_06750 [Candidatus Altiarchaeota archaeon]
MKNQKKTTWFGKDPETGKWYGAGWEIIGYIPTTKTNYLINLSISSLISLAMIYVNYTHNHNSVTRDFLVQSTGLGIITFFCTYRIIEFLLTGKCIWRIFDVSEGEPAIIEGLGYAIILIFLFLLVGGYINV